MNVMSINTMSFKAQSAYRKVVEGPNGYMAFANMSRNGIRAKDQYISSSIGIAKKNGGRLVEGIDWGTYSIQEFPEKAPWILERAENTMKKFKFSQEAFNEFMNGIRKFIIVNVKK